MVLFWMSYKDFITYYSAIGICYLYSDYVYSYMHVSKSKTNKGMLYLELKLLIIILMLIFNYIIKIQELN